MSQGYRELEKAFPLKEGLMLDAGVGLRMLVSRVSISQIKSPFLLGLGDMMSLK